MTLLKLYLSVASVSTEETENSEDQINKDYADFDSSSLSDKNLDAAVRLLSKHATKIDPLRALKLLPAQMPLRSVRIFLESVTKHFLTERREGQIFRNLLLAQHLQVQAQRIQLQQSLKIVVDEQDVCNYCLKRIGKRWVLMAICNAWCAD